jgi:hypothetical protein
MKTIAVFVLTLFSCGAGARQALNASKPSSHRSDAERTVAMLLADNGQAPITGFTQTVITRLGDGAAVGVIQYLGERKTTVSKDATSPEEVRRILLILRMSFAAPQIIQSDENRSPRATLILLRYLSSLPAAGAVKDDIRSACDFIEQLKVHQLNENSSS